MSTPFQPGSDGELAIRLARCAGDRLRASFQGPLGGHVGHLATRRNGPHDVVTRLDAAVEERISMDLATARPTDGFVGEETSTRPFSGTGVPRTWVVDPIDGTVGFAAGLPFFSVSIALLVGTKVTAGVVHDPVHREMFVAIAGAGAWLIDDSGSLGASGREPEPARRLHGRRLAQAADAVVCADPGDADDASARARVSRLGVHVRVVRTFGSTALSLAYLAAGRVDGVLQVRGLQAVDIAAGGLLAIESGAVVTDAGGGPWLSPDDLGHGRGIAAAGRSLQSLLLSL